MFADDWSFYGEEDDALRAPVGLTGILERDKLINDEIDAAEPDECVDQSTPPMFFDG